MHWESVGWTIGVIAGLIAIIGVPAGIYKAMMRGKGSQPIAVQPSSTPRVKRN